MYHRGSGPRASPNWDQPPALVENLKPDNVANLMAYAALLMNNATTAIVAKAAVARPVGWYESESGFDATAAGQVMKETPVTRSVVVSRLRAKAVAQRRAK
jgi:hypothetical protein